jgi:hypothetical protein
MISLVFTRRPPEVYREPFMDTLREFDVAVMIPRPRFIA